MTKTINEMSLDELYNIKGKLSTNFEIIQNDPKQINQKIIELRQRQLQQIQQSDNIHDINNKRNSQ